MEHKTLTSYQLDTNDRTGVVEHLISTFGVVDLVDDVVHPGAYLDSIKAIAKIRVLDQHKSDSVLRVIGKPLALRELKRADLPAALRAEYPEATGALWAKTQYLLDTPEGMGAYRRIAAGAVGEYSIGYNAQGYDYGTVKGRDGQARRVRNLRKIQLMEYSPVVFAAGLGTMTLDVKARRRAPDWLWHQAVNKLLDALVWSRNLTEATNGIIECERLMRESDKDRRQRLLDAIERGERINELLKD